MKAKRQPHRRGWMMKAVEEAQKPPPGKQGRKPTFTAAELEFLNAESEEWRRIEHNEGDITKFYSDVSRRFYWRFLAAEGTSPGDEMYTKLVVVSEDVEMEDAEVVESDAGANDSIPNDNNPPIDAARAPTDKAAVDSATGEKRVRVPLVDDDGIPQNPAFDFLKHRTVSLFLRILQAYILMPVFNSV